MDEQGLRSPSQRTILCWKVTELQNLKFFSVEVLIVTIVITSTEASEGLIAGI